MQNGTKFRLPKFYRKDVLIGTITEDITKYVNTIDNNKYNSSLEDWKTELIKQINVHLSKSCTYKNTKYSFDHLTKSALEQLQSKFVVTCVDKANKNYAVICKRYYRELLLKEVGYPNNTSPTYDFIDRDEKSIIDSFYTTAYKYNIPRINKHDSLPFIQMIPKFHKTPTGSRIIIASSRCCTKNLSKRIGKILKHVQSSMSRYCKAIHRNNGYNPFWIISSNEELLNRIKDLSNNKKVTCVNTFDFEKLYTNIDHQLLNKAIQNVIRIAFGNTKRYVNANDFITHWCSDKTAPTCYEFEEVIKMIEMLVDNTFFTLGNKCFKQTIGIPMGTDCAPFLANLFLFDYEYRYIMNKIKTKQYDILKSLRWCYRYIDDISILNDNDKFKTIYKDIYPNCLNLKQVNTTNQAADILDISIRINNRTAETVTYDKRNDFDFEVKIFPHFDSNIHVDVLCNTISEQVYRHAILCNTNSGFVDTLNLMFGKLLLRGYSKDFILGGLRRVYHRRKIHKIHLPLTRLLKELNIFK
jgi:hypothetical protein